MDNKQTLDILREIQAQFNGNIICVVQELVASTATILHHCLNCCANSVFICLSQNFSPITAEKKSKLRISNYLIMQITFEQLDLLSNINPKIILFDNLVKESFIFKSHNSQQIIEKYQAVFSKFSKDSNILCWHDAADFACMQSAAARCNVQSITSFGHSVAASIHAIKCKYDGCKTKVMLRIDKCILSYQLPTVDSISVISSLAVFACFKALRLDFRLVVKYLMQIDVNGYYPLKLNENKPLLITNKHIGFIWDLSSKISLSDVIATNLLSKAVIVNRILTRLGYRAFFYSPLDIDFANNRVTGYFIKNKEFVRDIVAVPTVNGNWLNKSADYQDFIRWTQQQNILIYNDLNLTSFFDDKLASYNLIARFNVNIQPYCEQYESQQQIETFFAKTNIVFLKARGRNKQTVLAKNKDDYVVTYYEHEEKKQFLFKTLKAVYEKLLLMDLDKHIIQHGILVQQYDKSNLEIYVNMLHDGQCWQWTSWVENKRKRFECNIINVFAELYGDCKAKVLIEQLQRLAFGVAKFISCFDSENVSELNLHFVLDLQQQFYLLAINSKAKLLAQNACQIKWNTFFLYRKTLAYSQITRDVWFDDVKQGILLSKDEINSLLYAIFEYTQVKNNFGKNLPKKLIRDRAPRIVFISISDGNTAAMVTCGRGIGIVQACQHALQQQALLFKPEYQVKWLKLDIVKNVYYQGYVDLARALSFERSLSGLAFAKSSMLAFIPEQLINLQIINEAQVLNLRKLKKYLEDNLSLQQIKLSWFKNKMHQVYFYKMDSYFYDGQKSKYLFRGHQRLNTVTKPELLSRVKQAGQYLVKAVQQDGRFIYKYLPKTDYADESYNMLRHAGTIYSMLELYQVTNNSSLLKAAKLSITFLLKHVKPVDKFSKNKLCLVENNWVKLGGNALTIIALAKYTQVTKDFGYVEIMQHLASWICSVQDDMGNFTIHKQHFVTQKPRKFISGYYPGEAMLALLRLHKIDQNQKWLNAVEKAAAYIINIRDKDKTIDQLAHDHWLLYALTEYYRLRPDSIYFEHIMKITTAIQLSQNFNPLYPDWLGSFYIPPRSTPVAIRAEGLCQVIQLIRELGHNEQGQQILHALKSCIIFQLQTQYQAESAMYFVNPQRVLGGFRGSLTVAEIRIDYVQHNISALLGYYKLLS